MLWCNCLFCGDFWMGCDQKMHHLVWPWCHHEILLFILFEQKWKYASFHTTNLIKTFEIFFLIYFRQVVMLLQVRLYSATISDTKIYIVDYPGLNHQVIAVQEDLKARGFTLWTLRSNIHIFGIFSSKYCHILYLGYHVKQVPGIFARIEAPNNFKFWYVWRFGTCKPENDGCSSFLFLSFLLYNISSNLFDCLFSNSVHPRTITELEYYIEGVVRLGVIAAILCTFLIFDTLGQQQRRYLYVKKVNPGSRDLSLPGRHSSRTSLERALSTNQHSEARSAFFWLAALRAREGTNFDNFDIFFGFWIKLMILWWILLSILV